MALYCPFEDVYGSLYSKGYELCKHSRCLDWPMRNEAKAVFYITGVLGGN